MVRLSCTSRTPVVWRAIRIALSFWVWLLTGPLSETTPFFVSTLMFSPAIVESAVRFDLTAAVIEASSAGWPLGAPAWGGAPGSALPAAGGALAGFGAFDEACA